MRPLLLLLLLGGWPYVAFAQVPEPLVTDTAALHFMRWRLSTIQPAPRLFRVALYAYSIHWRAADFGTEFYRASTFRERLLPVQGADSVGYSAEKLAADRIIWRRSGLVHPIFSLADLAAMKKHYEQDTRGTWPVLVAQIPLTTHKSVGRRVIVHGFTRPLFSLDGNYALLWELTYLKGRSLGAHLNIYKRVTATIWQLVPARLPGQTA